MDIENQTQGTEPPKEGSVYVDAAIWPYRHMVMCHMLADHVEDLHRMANAIGIKRRWFQNDKYPHYDICKTKRALAIQKGAIEIDRNQFVALARKLRAEKQKP